MNLDRFTNKAQASFTDTKTILTRFGHNHGTPKHLLLSMLEQEDSWTPVISHKLNSKLLEISDDLEKYLAGLAKGSAVNMVKDELHVSTKLMQLLEAAAREAEQMKDQYISLEHLLIALCDPGKGQSGTILKQHGITRDKIMEH